MQPRIADGVYQDSVFRSLVQEAGLGTNGD